jgi:hypothetical protein
VGSLAIHINIADRDLCFHFYLLSEFISKIVKQKNNYIQYHVWLKRLAVLSRSGGEGDYLECLFLNEKDRSSCLKVWVRDLVSARRVGCDL